MKAGGVSRVTFRNGATLRFFTGGGGDKSRAGYTSRVLFVTEVDGMATAGGTSEEADKIKQAEGCTRSFGDRARIYLECTVTVEPGRIWQEYSKGTASKIVIRCVHCRQYVTPEREHLTGWRDAVDVIAAGEHAAFACPGCGHLWSEADRIAANRDCKLLHAGQEITAEGVISGTAPRTDTLGFRWTAANNLLIKTSEIGMDEYKAARAFDEDNAEKEMCQYIWVVPFVSKTMDLKQLDAHQICKRTIDEPRGHVPDDIKQLTVFVDLGKRLLHWGAIGWRKDGSPHVVDYGRREVPIDAMAEETALRLALREFRDEICHVGWQSSKGLRHADAHFIDSGWNPDVVHEVCKESGAGWWATKGFGAKQYRTPKKVDDEIRLIGNHYHVKWQKERQAHLVEFDADYWKARLHARLRTPLNQPGAMTLFSVPNPNDHLGFAKHQAAEREGPEELVAGKGLVRVMEQIHHNNHWLDVTAGCGVAAHAVGIRLEGEDADNQEEQNDRPAPAGNSADQTDYVNAYKGRY